MARFVGEDLATACFRFESGIAGTGVWNFNADRSADRSADGIAVSGSDGELHMPLFTDSGLILRAGGREQDLAFANPPHVHQPLVQTVVDELLGRGRCESTGRSGARASRVMEQCLAGYYGRDADAG